MHIAFKAGLVIAGVLGLGAATHHLARAESLAPTVAQAAAGPVIPAELEAHVRAMARAHAPQGADPAAAELHAMLLIKAHLAEVAKDPAMTAQANQIMAAAAAGDKDALDHVHAMLQSIIEGGALHH